MNPNDPTMPRPAALNWLGVLGAFVVMVVLVAALRHYTQVPTVDEARAQERYKIHAEIVQAAAHELSTPGWIDKEKGIVRLPNQVATELAVTLWKDPAKARADLLERADKAFFVPPPPPEAPSEFE